MGLPARFRFAPQDGTALARGRRVPFKSPSALPVAIDARGGKIADLTGLTGYPGAMRPVPDRPRSRAGTEIGITWGGGLAQCGKAAFSATAPSGVAAVGQNGLGSAAPDLFKPVFAARAGADFRPAGDFPALWLLRHSRNLSGPVSCCLPWTVPVPAR